MKQPKQRCSNCAARNSRVKEYEVRDWRGIVTDRQTLCEECAGILRQIVKQAGA